MPTHLIQLSLASRPASPCWYAAAPASLKLDYFILVHLLDQIYQLQNYLCVGQTQYKTTFCYLVGLLGLGLYYYIAYLQCSLLPSAD